MGKLVISDEKLESIKNNIHRFSYIDLVIWRNEMITSGEINNSLFYLLNRELLDRANENKLNTHKSK